MNGRVVVGERAEVDADITAALTAPNADHIFLYESSGQVIDQLKQAEFAVVSFLEGRAYGPKAGEPVPRVAAFLVR